MGYKKSYCSSIAVQENKKVIQNIDISTIVWLLLYGEPAGIRTPDPRLRRPVLYPTELLTHVPNDINYNSIKKDRCQAVFEKNLNSGYY